MKITANFTWEEFEWTSTGLPNAVSNPYVLSNIQYGCANVLQPLRNYLGVPVRISSGYRSAAVNKKVGGVATSQHLIGEAADLVVPAAKFAAAVDFLTRVDCVDQILSGRGFIHVSWIRPRLPRHYVNLTYYR